MQPIAVTIACHRLLQRDSFIGNGPILGLILSCYLQIVTDLNRAFVSRKLQSNTIDTVCQDSNDFKRSWDCSRMQYLLDSL